MINLDLTLTWDFFVLVFFAVIIAHSFIVGKNHSVKIILSTYIAIIAVQGISTVLQHISTVYRPYLSLFGVSLDTGIITTISLFLFVTFIILIAAKGGLDVIFVREHKTMIGLGLTAVYGFFSAGLLLSTFLVIVSGNSVFVGPSIETYGQVLEASRLIRALVVHQPVWFTAPAILVVITGFIGTNKG